MPFDFFENGLAHGSIQNPNDYFRDLTQASIDQNWDCTSAKYTIQQQKDFGSDEYKDIEVWIDYIVGMGSRGMTNGDDFRKLLFRDINYPARRGLYYKFDNNTWLTYFTDEFASLSKDIGVRRCNNVMRIIDPENGSIFTIPCVVDYDMGSPYRQVSTNILTPNNHATIMVQGNQDTLRLFKLNTRYILGGRPFKLLGQQNALLDESIAPIPTLIYLDLYLDELHAKDDIAQQIADNGVFDYVVKINANDMELTQGTTGTLESIVTLNGEEVNRPIQWSSSDTSIVTIDEMGNYEVVGTDGQQCRITATLQGNDRVASTIKVKVVSVDSVQPKIIIAPSFDTVRQYETIKFEVQTVYGSQEIIPEDSTVSLDKDTVVLENNYLSIVKNGNQYQITGLEIANSPQTLYITAQNTTPQFNASEEFVVEAVSMLG